MSGFLPFVQKQLTLADQVFVVYEAVPAAFTCTANSPPSGSALLWCIRKNSIRSIKGW